MKHPTVPATGWIRDRYDVIGRDARDPLTPSPESFPMSDARIRARDAPAAIEPLHELAARALAARRYTPLAALAAGRVSAPTVLDTSAPLLAVGRDSELVATVSGLVVTIRGLLSTVSSRTVHSRAFQYAHNRFGG